MRGAASRRPPLRLPLRRLSGPGAAGGGAFFLESPYGEGSYRGGVFALRLEGLPLRLLEEARLYGEAVYREGALSGALRLEGRALRARARLRGLAADLEGRLSTPWEPSPFPGPTTPRRACASSPGGYASPTGRP